MHDFNSMIFSIMNIMFYIMKIHNLLNKTNNLKYEYLFFCKFSIPPIGINIPLGYNRKSRVYF